MGNVLYQFQNLKAPVSSIIFLIGATCLYLSFYRTRLIPRWLSVWGLIGVVSSMASALLNFFHMDTGYWVLFGNGVGATGNSNGGLVDREGIQSICDRCPVCQNRKKRSVWRRPEGLTRQLMVILNEGLSTPESGEPFTFTVVSTTNKNL